MAINVFCIGIVLCTIIMMGAIDTVSGHSWVECTDYVIADITSNNFDESACSGWGRSWGDYNGEFFGDDAGQHYEIDDDSTNLCEKSIGSPDNGYDDTYDSQYPMAEYTVGDTIRILWPAKNHANGADCDVSNQRDNAMQILANLNVNPTEDYDDIDDWTIIKDWHADSDEVWETKATDGDESVQSFIGHEGVPYQQCPNFCDDKDHSICYGDLVIPALFSEAGVYTFMWYWEFKANEIYTHCFEAYVSLAAEGSPSTSPTDKPVNDPTVAGSPTDRPTSLPTDKPTTTAPIMLKKESPVNDYYLKLYVYDVAEGVNVSLVEMRDSGTDPDAEWTIGEESTYVGDIWIFKNVLDPEREWVLPYDVRITGDDGSEPLTTYGVVTTDGEDDIFDFQQNFGTEESKANVSDSGSESGSEEETGSYILYIIIGVVCLVLILTLLGCKKYRDGKKSNESSEVVATAIASPDTSFKGLSGNQTSGKRGPPPVPPPHGAISTPAHIHIQTDSKRPINIDKNGRNIGAFTAKSGEVKFGGMAIQDDNSSDDELNI